MVYSVLNMKPYSMLISVEPNPRTYNVLLKNIHLLYHVIAEKKLKIYTINRAVYISHKVVKLKLTRWSETSHISVSGNINVQTITLEEIFSLFQHLETPEILLKMDIEGTEHNLFMNEQCLKLLGMCKRIAIEPHGNIYRIKKALEYLGFVVSVQSITLEPTLCLRWLRYSPKLYTNIIAIYRLIVSSIFKPKITIVKAERY